MCVSELEWSMSVYTIKVETMTNCCGVKDIQLPDKYKQNFNVSSDVYARIQVCNINKSDG